MYLPFLNTTIGYLVPLVAPAPEGGGSLWNTLVESNAINVVLAVMIIVFVVKKLNVGGTIEKSRTNIVRELEHLEQTRKDAEAQLRVVEAKTKSLTQEVDTILATARTSAENISRQILENARLDAERIVEMSKKRMEMEQKSAARDLEKRLLADALQDARLELAQNLNGKDQHRSVEAFLEELNRI